MTTNDDALNQWFAAVQQAHAMPDVDRGLEGKLIQEMKDIPARRRRRRIIVAIALGATLFSVTGVHAAGGFRVIQQWLSDVRMIDIHFGPEGGQPSVLMRNDAGEAIGRGQLPPPDENGDYSARILTDE